MPNIPHEYDPPWSTEEARVCADCGDRFYVHYRDTRSVCKDCLDWWQSNQPEVEDG